VKLPSQFAALAPKVREFLETRAFGEPVVLEGAAMIKAISSNVAQYVTVRSFVGALRGLVLEQLTPRLESAGRRLSETPPFPYSRPTCPASKTVFNLVTCDNEYERKFAGFLEQAADVAAFAKLPSQFGFAIEYTDAANNLRYYEPDFVARLADGTHYLVETKGREDLDVAHKDRAAVIWCDNATLLTGTGWSYVKVPQAGFGKLQPTEFADLVVFAPQLAASAPAEGDVTTQQAADLLNVPHPYLLDLLESGAIPFRASGPQRLLRERDLLSFKSKRDSERDEALAELTRLSQELGLYREGN
jgi:type III restriction enzyme